MPFGGWVSRCLFLFFRAFCRWGGHFVCGGTWGWNRIFFWGAVGWVGLIIDKIFCEDLFQNSEVNFFWELLLFQSSTNYYYYYYYFNGVKEKKFLLFVYFGFFIMQALSFEKTYV